MVKSITRRIITLSIEKNIDVLVDRYTNFEAVIDDEKVKINVKKRDIYRIMLAFARENWGEIKKRIIQSN